MITEIVEYRTLQQVRDLFDKTYDKKFIFRGQSNGFSNLNEKWGLTSSFKRYYNNQEVSFNTFILNNLDRGKFNLYFSNTSIQIAASSLKHHLLRSCITCNIMGFQHAFLIFQKIQLSHFISLYQH